MQLPSLLFKNVDQAAIVSERGEERDTVVEADKWIRGRTSNFRGGLPYTNRVRGSIIYPHFLAARFSSFILFNYLSFFIFHFLLYRTTSWGPRGPLSEKFHSIRNSVHAAKVSLLELIAQSFRDRCLVNIAQRFAVVIFLMNISMFLAIFFFINLWKISIEIGWTVFHQKRFGD